MKKVLLVLGVLTVSAVLLVLFLVFTQKGLLFTVQLAQTMSGGKLQTEDVGGRLGDAFILKGVRYTSETADMELDTVDLSWSPLELFKGRLHIRHFGLDGLRIVTADAGGDDSTKQYSLPEIGLPFEIVIDSLEVTSLRLESKDSTITTIDRLELQVAANQKQLELGSLQLKSDLVDLQITGSVGLASGWPVDLAGNWNARPPGTAEITGDVRLSGTLADGQLVIAAHSPFSAVLESEFHLGETLAFSSSLQAKEFDPSPFLSELPASLDILAEVSGQLDDKGVQADIVIQRIEGDVNGFDIEVRGNGRFVPNSLVVESLQVKHHSAELTLQGQIDDRVQTTFKATSPDISVFLSDARGSGEITGTVSGDVANPEIRADLQARSLSYNGVEIGEAEVEAKTGPVRNGRVTVGAVLKNARLGGQDIDRVSVNGRGTLADHRFEIDITHPEVKASLVSHGSFAGQTWQGSIDQLAVDPQAMDSVTLDRASPVRVSAEEVYLDPLCLVQSEARICVEGMLRDKNWKARVEIDNFNPKLIAREYPGQVHATLSGYGSLDGAFPESTIELSDLQGEVRNMAIGGGAKAQIRGSAVALQRVDLQYGNASLEAAGSIGDNRYDLSFSGDIPDIGSFMPEWSGSVKGKGTLAGERTAPSITAEVTAEDISGEPFSLERAVADINMDLHRSGIVGADISIFGLQGGGRSLSGGKIDLAGTTEAHTFEADLRSDVGSLVLHGSGRYHGDWSGVLEIVQFDSETYGKWSLRKESGITIGKTEGGIDGFCPVGPKAQLCFSAQWDEQRQWRLETDIDSFNVSLLNDTGLVGAVLDGGVEGKVSAQGVGGSLKDIAGWLGSDEIEILNTGGDERLEYIFVDNRLDFDMKGTQLKTELRSNFGGDGEVVADITFTDVTSGTTEIVDIPLEGNVTFDLADLTFITLLTNSHVQPAGRLRGSLSLGGRLGSPETAGKVQLEDGSIYISSVGITLEEVSADIENRGELLDFILTARSGNGTARGEGQLHVGMDGSWMLLSHLVGSDFRLMATDQYVIDATPDIDLRLGEGENYIKGRLAVPYARITLKRKESRVTPSDDVIIVDRRDDEGRQKNGLAIDLDVDLGEDVEIDAYGLKSSLAGSMTIEKVPGRLLTGFGELTVEDGLFVFYSAELEVTRGRLLFSGGSIDNPGIDFRAQREVENRVVGAEVGGTAQDLEISLFSDPAMDESNILAYMLVGRSLYASSENQQSLIGTAAAAIGMRGINTITNSLQQYLPVDEVYLDGSTTTEDISLVMGKHITDDIFIGYDHNFFDSSGEFKIRYDLGRNFSVETRTSVDSTSGDVLYTIEK